MGGALHSIEQISKRIESYPSFFDGSMHQTTKIQRRLMLEVMPTQRQYTSNLSLTTSAALNATAGDFSDLMICFVI